MPEVYVSPVTPALRTAVEKLQTKWPGVALEEQGGETHLRIRINIAWDTRRISRR